MDWFNWGPFERPSRHAVCPVQFQSIPGTGWHTLNHCLLFLLLLELFAIKLKIEIFCLMLVYAVLMIHNLAAFVYPQLFPLGSRITLCKKMECTVGLLGGAVGAMWCKPTNKVAHSQSMSPFCKCMIKLNNTDIHAIALTMNIYDFKHNQTMTVTVTIHDN